MKQTKTLIVALIGFAVIAASIVRLWAADIPSQQPHRFEYATIRWAGINDTSIIRPNGEVEFVAGKLQGVQKPNRVDSRSFYMNLVMNGLAKEGYEFVGISSDDIVMKRDLPH